MIHRPKSPTYYQKSNRLICRDKRSAQDCSADGNRLVVLTYAAVWLFERDSLEQSFFAHRIFWAPFPERDAEAICFADDDTLLVADESLGELYEIRIADLSRLQ